MNNYLIPANSKKSLLILGFFNALDLAIFVPGVIITLVLLVAIQSANLGVMVMVLSPVLITGFLVMPVPYYHNVLQFIINVYTFYSEPRRYVWKGWCYDVEE